MDLSSPPLSPFVDPLRVPPRRVIKAPTRLTVRLETATMYHCHILEHEDYDMMRPFVLMPPELMPFMDGGQ